MISDEKFGYLKIDEMPIDLDEIFDEDLAKIEEEIIKQKNEFRNIIDTKLGIQENTVELKTNEQSIEAILLSILTKQHEHSILKAIRNVKKSRKLVNSYELQFEQYINEQAKKYGQSSEILNNEILKYRDILESLNNSVANIKKVLIEQKEEVQYLECEKTIVLIANSGKSAISENEIIQLRNQILDLRKLSFEIDKQIDQFTANLKDYIECLLKNEELIVVNEIDEKKAFLQKLFSTIFDKIDGANKFNQIVVVNIKNKIDRIEKNLLPEVLHKAKQSAVDYISDIIGKTEKISNPSDIEIDYTYLANEKINKSTDSFKNIIDNGNKKRMLLLKF